MYYKAIKELIVIFKMVFFRIKTRALKKILFITNKESKYIE